MATIADKSFAQYISSNMLILDGACGTQMQRRGLPPGVCPEQWAIEHKDVLLAVHREYVEAGSQAIYTFTFGGNSVKLNGYGVTDVYGVNRTLALLAREAAGDNVFVGGDVSSTGVLFEPMGDMTFDRAYDIFAEQIKGLVDGDVDFIVIETMMDLNEAQAALMAAKDVCRLPVVVSMTFEENGRTLMGSSPVDVVSALQSAGADVIGVNCSAGPDRMARIVAGMQSIATIPILAKPNAGVPEIIDGNTIFTMDPNVFRQYVRPLAMAGASLIGGCCGTTPEFIEAIAQELKNQKPVPDVDHSLHYISCVNNTLFMGESPIVISKSINPSNKEVYEPMAQSDYEPVLDAALADGEEGALGMNISAYRMENEGDALVRMAEMITTRTKMPVCFRSDNDEAITYALKRYTGRALVYPKHYGTDDFLRLLPTLNTFGALAVFSPHSYKNDYDVRLQIKHKVIDIIKMTDAAEELGYPKDHLIINVTAGGDTQQFVRWCIGNGYKAAVDSQKLDGETLALAIDHGASLIFADTRDSEKMEIVRRYI